MTADTDKKRSNGDSQVHERDRIEELEISVIVVGFMLAVGFLIGIAALAGNNL